jgi:hypothetical protein
MKVMMLTKMVNGIADDSREEEKEPGRAWRKGGRSIQWREINVDVPH